MKRLTVCCCLLLALPALFAGAEKNGSVPHRRVMHRYGSSLPIGVQETFNLRDYGAIGDGITDDGPALQAALNAIGDAGGGTLLVPPGRYAIYTPVIKNFTGLATEITIAGIESITPVPPPNSNGQTLTHGLDLTSEFLPRTGEQGITLIIAGLRRLLIKDLAFVGTPDVNTDARITVYLDTIEHATIRHCEFYGLSTQKGEAIVLSVRSGLAIEQTVFLGSTANSGIYGSVVQNLEWKAITISDTVFADYGQRPELFSKTGLSAPFSWVNIGNAAALTNDSPRRQVEIRRVFLDEGGLSGLSSLPYGYQPASAPIDLVYVSGLHMNVSNLGTSGHYFDGLENVLIENSHYGWSHNSGAAIRFLGAAHAILDRVECLDDANRIGADAATAKLTVINSIYTHLDSQAQETRVITTETPEEDPVQYVRQQFSLILGRDPDAAAHFYWSDRLLQCGEHTQCVINEHAALVAYLNTTPDPLFSATGRITNEKDEPLSGVTVTLSGSQNGVIQTDADGRYVFNNLPTSGIYTITPNRTHYTFDVPRLTVTTPRSDVTADFPARHNQYAIHGSVLDAAGQPIPNAVVTLSGGKTESVITDASGNYIFVATAEADYTITPSRVNYTLNPASQTITNFPGDSTANFSGSLVSYTLSGRVTNDGVALSGVTVSLSGAQSANVISGTDGKWSFAVPAEGDYTVTPSLNHYTFLANQGTFHILSANQNIDFQASLNRHRISGRVTKADGSGFPGTTMTLSGAKTATTTTDASGNYSFANLAAGRDYVVDPSRSNYAFGPATTNFNDLSTDQTLNITGGLVSYTLNGRISGSGKDLGGVTVTLSGSQTAAAITDVKGQYSFKVPAEGNYTITPTKTNYLFSPASTTFNLLSADHPGDFDGALQRLLEFSAISFSASETARTIAVNVTRTGDTSEAAEVTYSAGDGSAQQRSDVIPIMGKLSFEPGETSKSFVILITDDTYVEGDESLTLRLTDPVGDTLDTISTATLTIVDNDANAAAPNAIDDAQFFVRQQYRDFLNRQADAEGLAFWSDQILNCGTDPACIADRRMNVSAAFFLSIEFQDTGFLVYRLYQAAYAQPPQHLAEFLLDTRTVGEGIIVGTAGWQQLLAANKASFIKAFVERPQFEEAYPSQLTPGEFVNQLNSRAGNVLSASEVSAAIAEFGGATESEHFDARAGVLLRVAEHQSFSQRQINPAFVLMQYFGYLKRNPHELPDTNLDGYAFWVQKLESFSGDFRRAEMVKAFLVSTEYRSRFGTP